MHNYTTNGTFRRIGEQWGSFLNLDVETNNNLSFDTGRMLIETYCSSKIGEWINLVINGRIYNVWVWEVDCDDPFSVISKVLQQKDMLGFKQGHPLILKTKLIQISSVMRKKKTSWQGTRIVT